MFELSLFNIAQFADQILALLGAYFVTSLDAKARMWGFVFFLLVNIPGTYILIVAELWWMIVILPIWIFLSLKGFFNNYKAAYINC